jgi:hypothetical protein
VTESRGHSGDNVGKDTVVTWVKEKRLLRKKAFVFGCTLFHDGELGDEVRTDMNIQAHSGHQQDVGHVH